MSAISARDPRTGERLWPDAIGRALRNRAFLAGAVTLIMGAVALNTLIASSKIHLKKIPIEGERLVSAIPAETPSWRHHGADRVEEEAMVEELGTSNYLNRMYVQRTPAEGRQPVALDLHLAYYTGMVDTVPHVPERCMVGGGWVQAGSTQVLPLKLDNSSWEFDREVGPPERRQKVYTARLAMDGKFTKNPGARVRLPFDPETIAMRITPFNDGDRKVFAGYFFIANGGHVPSAEDVRLLAFRLKDDYAFYLKVQVSSGNVQSEQEMADAAGSLLSELLPEIMLCVPDWIEVEEGNYPADNPRKKAVN